MASLARTVWKVGVTGGIGSGKSNVCSVLRSLGAVTIDADVLGHNVYAPGTQEFDKVVKTFGNAIVGEDGKINRRALGQLVFGDSNKANMKKLTDIVWPAIAEKTQNLIIEEEKKGVDLVFIEAAVLVEARWFSFMDEVWVTSVPRDVAVQRVIKRNQISVEEANKRIDTQISNEEREAIASVVIATDRPIEETNELVKSLFESLRSKIKEKGGAEQLRENRRKSSNDCY